MPRPISASVFISLLAGFSRVAATSGWHFVQNGTTGLLALEATIVSPTLALLYDLSATRTPLLMGNESAWGALYDLTTNVVTPIQVNSDTFCASGATLSNGSTVSVGGNWIPTLSQGVNGYQGLRIFEPCTSPSGVGCTLYDDPSTLHLTAARWYPSAIRIYDGSLFIAGGSLNFSLFYNEFPENSYEFFPPRDGGVVRPSPFLVRAGKTNMFPRIFSLTDGTIFMVAGNQSIIYNVDTKKETRLPDIPNGVKVSNPFDGSAQLLPLSPPNYIPEVLVCGGSDTDERIAPPELSSQTPASDQCSRIELSPAGIKRGWIVERMPERRILPEMLILPTGQIIIVNGAQTGYSAFSSFLSWIKDPVGNSNADHPNFTPTLYDPLAPVGKRMIKKGLPTTNIARMYHSTATVTPSGQVSCFGHDTAISNCANRNILIAGSNPQVEVNTTVPYPTEFRVEYLNPPYMYLERPVLSRVPAKVAFDAHFTLQVTLPKKAGIFPTIKVALMDLGFSSHAFHSSNRLVYLEATLDRDHKTLHITSPPNNRVYPPGPGYLYVVVADEYVSVGAQIMIGSGASPPVPDQGRRL
ncbi:hypothetical protein MIND_00381500 [Mycena indigotica]|uniref:Glyoxal oxidase n=1 Tax=Mycena indigotica TaxID=2126181 RepID=A0A8H6W9U9_9AGAR|nr:uncharacterized protein MIND_00381500 [Mycena indigotica]KAF7310082.1 hypothetical protein MIND_00381500 [Mycena indigotica]